MLRRVVRLLLATFPLFMAVTAWLGWRLLPEQPLRRCPLEYNGGGLQIVPPTGGGWAIFAPTDIRYPADLNYIFRFDPEQGTTEKLPTPNRTSAIIGELATTVWPWADGDGRVHVVELPQNRPIFTTPPDPTRRSPRLFMDPEKRWLFIGDTTGDRIDVWHLRTGEQGPSLTVGPSDYLYWTFLAADRPAIIRRMKSAKQFDIHIFSLPDGREVDTLHVPCTPWDIAYASTDGRYLYTCPPSPSAIIIWDLGVSPPRQVMGQEPPYSTCVSPNGRHRLLTYARSRSWLLENVATGNVISRADENGTSDGQRGGPLSSAFIREGRLLLLGRYRDTRTLPAWAPGWLVRLFESSRFAQRSDYIAFGDPETGHELREVPGSWFVQMAPTGERVWLGRNSGPDFDKALEEWPIAAPPPPWWLWAITAVGLGWLVLRWRQRRARRPALQIAHPAVA